MAILPIRTFPDPCLHTPSRPVTRVTSQTLRLIDDLVDTMRHHPRCVGLAACQVGSPASLAVVDVTGHPKATRFPRQGSGSLGEDPEARGRGTSGLLVLINPRILAQEERLVQREGCLSVPDLTANVQRAPRIHVQALDRAGKPWTRWLEGFEAIAVQHEVDHLAGKLFLDRVTNVRTDLFRRKRYWFPDSGTQSA